MSVLDSGVAPEPDPFFFDFVETDELSTQQRWSRFNDVGVLTGPEPYPDWVITDDAAIDHELGILKTGKEADVFLLQRFLGEERSVIMAAKRYRSPDQRQFQRDDAYSEGRRMRNTRDRRATAKNTAWGRQVKAGAWAAAEFGFLTDLWSAGLPVPYPVQLDGTEILMELITDADGQTAPRLAQSRPSRPVLELYWEQLVAAMRLLAGLGWAHGDLSAFNLLATGERIVIIDLPQAVDIAGNPHGMEFLARDCRNVATWFAARGLDVDGDELLADLISYTW